MKKTLVIVGAGAWGSALAIALSDKFEEIMGVCHKTLDVEGVQFHPESILTEHGHQMLNTFLQEHN